MLPRRSITAPPARRSARLAGLVATAALGCALAAGSAAAATIDGTGKVFELRNTMSGALYVETTTLREAIKVSNPVTDAKLGYPTIVPSNRRWTLNSFSTIG